MNFLVLSLAANAGFVLICYIVLKLAAVEDWFTVTAKTATYRSWTAKKGAQTYGPRENSRRLGGILQEPSLHLSIVIPCYNEESRLPVTVPNLVKYLEARHAVDPLFLCEIIIVDDGSSDNTLGVAETFAKFFFTSWLSFRIIDLESNNGKGFATKAGVLASLGEYILMMDADGATKIEDLELLERAIIQLQLDDVRKSSTTPLSPHSPFISHPAQSAQGRLMFSSFPEQGTSAFANLNTKGISNTYFAFGSRAHLVESPEVSKRVWYRNCLMNVFRILVALLIGTIAQDTQCGFKLFPRKTAIPLFMSLHTTRWAFDCELFCLAKKYHIKHAEIPVQWKEVPGSKLSLLPASLGMLFDLIRIRVLYSLKLWRPVHAGRTRDSVDQPKGSNLTTWQNM